MRSYLPPLLLALLILLPASRGSAQHKLGVKWDLPSSSAEVQNRLDTLKSLGVEWLLVNDRLDNDTWRYIEEGGFKVYAAIPIVFPIARTFNSPDSTLLHTVSRYVNHYATQSSVNAIGLFSNGAVSNPRFQDALEPFTRQIKSVTGDSLFFLHPHPPEHTPPTQFDFFIHEMRIDGNMAFNDQTYPGPVQQLMLYDPTSKAASYLTPFKEFLKRYGNSSMPVFVDMQWLMNTMDRHPTVGSTLRLFTSDSNFIFPTPEEEIPSESKHDPIVLLLLIIWGVFFANYNVSPVYRKSLNRYFLSHTFFVDDVMQRHIRTSGATTTLLLQHSLLAGICIYSMAYTLLSPVGLEALFYHYPALGVAGNSLASLFLLGCLLSLALSIVSILWISLSNKKIREYNQVVNLYAWPLQLNFVVATLMVILLKAGSSGFLIVGLGTIFILIQLFAFLVTSADTARNLFNKRGLFLSLTAGLYLLGLAGAIYWYFKSEVPEVLDLALYLS